ncbi:MAG: hypothetical protein Q9184_001392 [Pyrenodesmia sp. 2 TL-2023]
MKVTATFIVAAAALGAKVALAAPVVERKAGVEAGVDTVAELMARGIVIRQNAPISGPPPPGPQCLPDGWCGASNAGIDPSCCSKHAVNDCCVGVGPSQKKRATPPLCVAGGNCSQGSPAGPKPDPKPSPSSEATPSPTASTDSASITPADPPPLLTDTTTLPTGTIEPSPLLTDTTTLPTGTIEPSPLLTDTTTLPTGTIYPPPLLPAMEKRAEEFTNGYSTPRLPTPSSLMATVTGRQHHVGPGWGHSVAIRPFPTTLATVVDKRDA